MPRVFDITVRGSPVIPARISRTRHATVFTRVPFAVPAYLERRSSWTTSRSPSPSPVPRRTHPGRPRVRPCSSRWNAVGSTNRCRRLV